MAASIQDQLAATGIAQVIVVLKGAEAGVAPPGPAAAGLALEGGSSLSLRQLAAGLEKIFVRTSETRDGAISAAAKVAKSRKRGAAPKAMAMAMSLESGTAGGAATAPAPRYFENLGIMLGSVDSEGLRQLDAHSAV